MREILFPVNKIKKNQQLKFLLVHLINEILNQSEIKISSQLTYLLKLLLQLKILLFENGFHFYH